MAILSSLLKAAPEVKKGKLHELLGVDPSEDISDHFKSGKAIVNKLKGKVSNNEAIKMLNFAHNISSNPNPVFKDAVDHLKKSK